MPPPQLANIDLSGAKCAAPNAEEDENYDVEIDADDEEEVQEEEMD